MDKESLLLVKSIIEANQQENPFKDYLFPVAISFFSAIMGGFIAMRINNKQEVNKSEKEKFNNSMRLMFLVIESLNNLVTIKANYRHIDTGNPYLRFWEFPEILFKASRLTMDLSDFSFIKEVQTCNFSRHEKIKRFIIYRVFRKEVKKPSKLELGKSWRNLSRLSAMISNYNTIIYQIDKRNVMDDEARKKAHDYIKNKQSTNSISFEAVLQSCLSDKEILQLIDLTELTISLVDHVIREMDSFVRAFPDIAESNIDTSKLMSGKNVIRYNNDRQVYTDTLIKTIEPDFQLLSSMFGDDLESIKKRYTLVEWY
ncbi:hypothetical protein Q3V30_22575 (plasmid) [Erwinia pyri]|uniref:Uncharacterized protein n=1 Tax=Erwinia pyri TaxID=3062598 RepID=A0AA50DNP6_9GAMM|nr:hypothetical protein [Erwinia sp. DE2]WLS81251.1 hypothetical protein Q3V30_22575 [Erwinia sp. DE2]